MLESLELWDDAHTDYTTIDHADAALPIPSGLSTTDTDWRTELEQAPNGWLLRRGSLAEMLASGSPIYLMHTTTYLEEIRASRQLYQAAGCLVGALYCAPLTREPGGLRPHNLGSYLLETKPHTRTLVFEAAPGGPVPAKGVNYLRLGHIHLRAYQQHHGFLTADEDRRLRTAAVDRVRQAAPLLDLLLANACDTAHTRPAEFIDRLADAVPAVPFLGYLYYEVLSEYLMLYSTSPETKACADLGELNNRPPKRLAFTAVDTMRDLFDLALFRPRHGRLRELIGQIEPGLAAGAADYTRRRVAHLFACVTLAPTVDAAAVTFRDVTFDRLAEVAPGLLGQLVFRQMRTLARYPQLFPVFEQVKATAVSAYWTAQGIPTPFNGVIPKGEIGLNLAYPSGVRAWVAETDAQGLLHPAEELPVTLVPRLADLRETALGRARFSHHAQPTTSWAATPAADSSAVSLAARPVPHR